MDDLLTNRLADRLKRLRHDRDWSLDRLGAESGISRATLSRIENADVSPTTQVLGKLCAALGLTMSRLLLDIEEGFTPLVRRADQSVWIDPGSGFQRRSVSPPAAALAAEVLECTLKAGMTIEYSAPPVPGAEHHLVMLDGCLAVSVDGEKHNLGAGDSLRYQLYGPSRFETSADQPARYVLVLVQGARLHG